MLARRRSVFVCMDDGSRRRRLAGLVHNFGEAEVLGEGPVGTAGLRGLVARKPDIGVIVAAEHELTGLALARRVREVIPGVALLTVGVGDPGSASGASIARATDRTLPAGASIVDIAEALRALANSIGWAEERHHTA